MIARAWLDVIRQRAEGYPLFRARDLDPEASHPRRLVAAWRARGDVHSVAPGYHLLAAEGAEVLGDIDLIAYLIAATRFGRSAVALCTISAARMHGVGGLDTKVATVTVPLPTRPVRLAGNRGTVVFCTRAEQVLGVRNVTLDDGDLDLFGAQAIARTVRSRGGVHVPVTTCEQTALDLIHDSRFLDRAGGLDQCLLRLAPQCEQRKLDRIAFDQRRRRARAEYRANVSLLLAWR